MSAIAERRTGFRIPLRAALVIGFGGLMLIAVSGALWLGLASATRNTYELLRDKAESGIGAITRHVDGVLRPVEIQGAWIAGEIAAGRVSFDDLERFDAFMLGTLATTPQTIGFAVILPDGTSRVYDRPTRVAFVEDWSARSDVTKALEQGLTATGPFWDEPFYEPTVSETVLILKTPLRRGGRYLGILGQVVRLSDLSRALVLQPALPDFLPFILYGHDRCCVVAHPLLLDADLASPEVPLPELATFGDGTLAEINNPAAEPLDILEGAKRIDGRAIDIGGREHVFVYQAVDGYGPEPLTIGVHIDRTGHTVALRRLATAGAFGVGVLLLSVLAALLIGRATGRPIHRLAAAARAVRTGHLDDFRPLRRTGLKELDDAAFSFNAMVDGLRERALIRDLIGKYVPEAVAAELIRGGGALTPKLTPATTMFVDVAGFTTLAERLGPDEVVAMLNEYFSAVAELLEPLGGVITQFQGDGILAVFNVPIPNADHAANAVRAALAIQRLVGERSFGGHRLECRAGIATGEVVAGNVGAGERMSYTVNGDVVNLAARLEQMNKTYETRILASEATAEAATGFPFRRIGEVVVRGKAEPAVIYALDA